MPNGYYPVYLDQPRPGTWYCAWHSFGNCGTVPILFGFFFKTDNDSHCDPHDDPSLTGHSELVAALANMSAHEISEARTNPQADSWYDENGNENGDKCRWTFPYPYVTFSDGSRRLQGEWSNRAYALGSGYPNLQGQRACLGGR